MIHTSVVIASVLSNSNLRDSYHFYILASGITEKNKRRIEKLHKIRDFSISYPTIDYSKLEIFKKVKRSQWVPIDTFNRVLMPDLLPDTDKAIFLDSDIVVMHDIAALNAINVDDCWIAGVEDLNYAGLVRMLGYDKQYTYINSGIYLMNLKAMRENNYYEHMVEVVEKEYTKYTVAEQCVINSCFHEHIKVIPHKWNMYHIFLHRPWYHFTPYDLTAWQDGFRNPAIVHFVGPDKPWAFDSKHPYRDQYLKYLKKTPYKGLIWINRFKSFRVALYHHNKSTEENIKKSEYVVLGVPVWRKTVTETKKRTTVLGVSITSKRRK
jgi:lipopolysaccharide biosynthesis glycosyltransferase